MTNGIQLGANSTYVDAYDAGLLEPIPRMLTRGGLGTDKFIGFDVWNAFEISWLNEHGVPRVAVAEFRFSASSTNIIESKSFKYYLNSFNQTLFSGEAEVREAMQRDLSAVADGDVSVTLAKVDDDAFGVSVSLPGRCIDDVDIQVNAYQPSVRMLEPAYGERVESKEVYSHLLKSNCPVTGQPDWATVWVRYTGSEIPEAGLLRYFISFRQYQGFHENCVERIFADLTETYAPESLCVYARYTRRGGLDINPIRMSSNLGDMSLPFRRTLRQ